jgi:hypothetical protein
VYQSSDGKAGGLSGDGAAGPWDGSLGGGSGCGGTVSRCAMSGNRATTTARHPDRFLAPLDFST